MLYTLFLFCSGLADRGIIQRERCADVSMAAHHVALDMRPLFASSDGRERTARFLTVLVAKESAGNPLAIGDGGKAHGATQIHPDTWGDILERYGFDYTSYFDLEQSMRMSLVVLHYLTKRCGSPKRAMYAYASGVCEGTPAATAKMNARCKTIGGCDE